MDNKLNPQQLDAVKTINNPLLVFAGAGTGKTRVITHRITYMLSSGIEPDSILAVTFTNKAANEMKERIAKMVGREQAKRIFISTFHSLGLFILKSNITNLGYRKNFCIYDTAECSALIRKILKEELPDWKPKVTPKEILSMISMFRLKTFSGDYGEFGMGSRILKHLLKFYAQYLKNCNAVDFDDLIFLPIKLLEDPEIKDKYQKRFKYIMIDEFQDTNGPQFELIKRIAGPSPNICVVGDDDQSIYRFRGSDFSHILNFSRVFPKTKVIKLEQNYRSTQTILKAANSVVQNNRTRNPKKLWSSLPSSSLIRLSAAPNDREEAREIVALMSEARIQEKFNWGEMAILYRTNSQSRIVEEELVQKKIPYQVIGGTKFYDRKEIKDVIAYLRVIHNPFDESAIYRIINVPARGIGQTSLSVINNYCLTKQCSFYDGLKVSEELSLPKSVKSSIKLFLNLIHKYQILFLKNSIESSIQKLLEEVHYKTEIEKHCAKIEDAEEKYTMCLEIARSAADHENDPESSQPYLESFLEKISLVSDWDSMKKKQKDSPPIAAVKLMTIHNSKGLEFPYVSIIGLNEFILPHEKSLTLEADLEEERRLLYVGITRAQRQLNLSYALSRSFHGKEINLHPSRFLKEIPPECIEDLSKPPSKEELKEMFFQMKQRFQKKPD